MDTNAEALKIAKNLTPIIEQVTYRMTENCMRSKLYTVSSVPSCGKIGVKDAFDEVEMQVPYSSALSKARVGDAVWCVWMGSNQSTMVAMWEGDLVSTSETDAILHVISPANSVVTISKGSYKRSSGGRVNPSDPSVYDYYFTIHWWQQDEIPWEVTARLGSRTATKEVVVDSTGEYDVSVWYRVPPEYQAVEYIQSSGTQWLDIDVAPAISFSAELKICSTANSEGLLGIGTKVAELYANSSSKYAWWISGGTTLTATNTIVQGKLIDIIVSRDSSGYSLTVEGETKTTSMTVSASASMNIFRYAGSSTYYAKGRIEHARIYSDGVLVRDMWACYRKSDSIAGMWDNVSDRFFTNSGSGTFAVGGNVD
jgi:hypothetical protein